MAEHQTVQNSPELSRHLSSTVFEPSKVQLLINSGADVNYKDADGRSTLYLLALDNNKEMVEFLLSKGANVGIRDLEGRTALHVSAWQGHADMVQVLVNHGADVNAVDNDCRTALQSAAWQGHVSVVHLLLERNATVDHVCNQGATALCIAAQEGHLEVIKALLEYGADPNHADQFGRNPMSVATKGGHDNVIHMLEEYVAHLQKVEKVNLSDSLSSISLTSASTAETKPCSAILCQPSYVEQLQIESPEYTSDKRRSLVSNQSSSKSSSILTNSTNKSTSNAYSQTAIAAQVDEELKCSSKSLNVQTKVAVISQLTFTQELQECTRNRSRIYRMLSPLSEPHNPFLSQPQSPLSGSQGQRFSPIQSISPDDVERNTSSYVPYSSHVPVIRESNDKFEISNISRKIFRSSCDIDSSYPTIRPSEPCIRRSGIITNPNFKGSYLISTKSNSIKKSFANNHMEPLKTKHSQYEESLHSNTTHFKKETHL